MATRSHLTRSSLRRSGSGSGSGSGIVSINGDGTPAQLITSADGSLTITQPVAGTTNLAITGGAPAATWPIANPRIYAVDGALGNDANKGFADAAGTSAGQYAAACAAAGLVAKRTIAGLSAIFPKIGADRTAVILIKSGTYTDDLATVLGGVEGYASGAPLIRGTITDATAGSVAFAGDSADETMSGGVTATGMNAPGYHPTGAPTSSQFQCLTLGGGAPGFGAEPAVPLGWRVRFDIATTTAALRGQCRQVSRVAGTDTLLLQTVLPAVPVAGDTFYLEMAGVVIPAFNLAAPANGQLGMQFSGIRSTGTWGLQFTDAQLCFCGANAFVAQQQTVNELGVSQTFTNPILGVITPGGGLRSETTFALNQGYASLLGVVSATSTTLNSDQVPVWGAGCAARNLIAVGCRAAQNVDTTIPATLGTTAATGIPHTFGNDGVAAIAIDGSDLTFQQLNVFTAGAFPCIQLRGKNSIIFAGVVGGTTGNTDVGLDLQNSAGSQVQILATAAPTVSGSTADIRWAGPAFGTWTQFQIQEQYDTAANHIYQVVTNAEYDHTISPSVTLQVNNSGGTANAYNLVSHTGASLQFKPAIAGDPITGVLDRQTGNGEAALVGAASGYRVVNFDAAPPLGSLVYVSPSTPGLATAVNPGNQVALGVVTGNSFAGNLAIVHFSVVTPAQPGTADWPVGIARVYAIDGTSGNDMNKGYADAATNSAGDLATATQQAGAVAKKTFAGLAKIFPRSGAGRSVVVVIRSGTYVGGLDIFLAGASGYANGCPLIRGTDTNTTAASVAFDGSAGDLVFVGGKTATGMNAAGYNPTGAATTTSLPCTKVGGGAPGFTAGGLAVPIGWRIRFDAATATAALRNFCTAPAEITTTTTLIPTQPFPAVPGATDVFYLEMAGVSCDGSTFDGINSAGPVAFGGNPIGIQVVGVLCPDVLVGMTVNDGLVTFVFCGSGIVWVGSLNEANASAAVATVFAYTDPAGGFNVTGGGLRVDGDGNFGNGNYNLLFSLVVTGIFSVNDANAIQLADGCAWKRMDLGNSFVSSASAILGQVGTPNLGVNFPAVNPPIVRGGAGTNGVRVVGSAIQIQAMNFQGCAGSPCISVRGGSIVSIAGIVAGSTGNTDVGLDLVNARGALVILSATPTVTGTAGDVRLAGGQILTWAQALVGIVDSRGNRIIGTSAPTGIETFSGAILGGAGATVSYLSGSGIIGAVNQTTAFRRPTSQRLMIRLRVTSISNTSANAVTCTLYKNGVATAMVVSIPAATAANTKFVDSAHPILYVDGDDFDLRLDDAADVGAVVNVSAGLEWAS